LEMSLLHAMLNRDIDTFKTLIQQGADPNDMYYGVSILNRMINLGRSSEWLDVLLKANADVNLKNPFEGISPLHTACSMDIHVGLLIRHKADINIWDDDGNLPLHKACLAVSKRSIQFLLAAGASNHINSTNDFGSTPFDCLIAFGSTAFGDSEDCVELLIDAGANINDTCYSLPPWATKIVEKRKKIKRTTLLFKGILRKRLRVGGPGAAYLGGALPKDMVNLLGLHLWDTRFNKKWE
jgi:ankyrin repeat protein